MFGSAPNSAEPPSRGVTASTKMPFKRSSSKLVYDYSQVATMHGIYYVFEPKYGVMSRLIWALCTIALVIVSFYLIITAYIAWQNSPIMTTVSTTGLPIYNISFPAITVCGLGSVRDVMYHAIYRQGEDYIQAEKGDDYVIQEYPEELEELLISAGLTLDGFIAEYYPGLIVHPEEVMPILVSKNPDAILTSEVSLEGYDYCNDSLTKALEEIKGKETQTNTLPCDTAEHAHDPVNNLCYKMYGLGTEDSLKQTCEDRREQPLYLDSPEKIKQLKKLLKLGTASLAGTSGIVMWVDEYIEEDSSYWEDVDYKYVEPSIATWQAYDLCSSLMYNSTLDKIVGTYSDCYAPSALVCSSAGAVNCDEVQDSDGGSHQAGGSGSVLESLINPVQTAELSKALLQKGKAYREVFKLMDLENAYPGLFEALWYSQIPCFDTEVKGANVVSRALLKKCFWKQVEIPCAAIFNTFPTDRGMCCTFNMAAADKIFKESQYRANVLYMQDRDREFATERSTKLPKSYTAKKEPIPQAGINKGLTLVLDAHTNLLSEGSVTEDFQGFVAVVAETNAYPLTEQRNIRLRPGFDNLVSLSATNIAAVSRIRQEDPKIRNCYFKDEVSLKMHIEYSQASCILECQIEFAQKNMSQSGEGVCAPWYLPFEDTSSAVMCDPWEAQKFSRLMRQVPDDTCEHCLPDCTVTRYQTSVTALPFRKCDEKNMGLSPLCDTKSSMALPAIFASDLRHEYDEGSGENLPFYVDRWESNTRRYSRDEKALFTKTQDLTYDAYTNDIATVHFYFEESTVIEFGRDLRMTWVDFVSQMGGLLGLCMGFSICSGFEIIYWFIFRMWAEHTSQSRPTKVQQATSFISN